MYDAEILLLLILHLSGSTGQPCPPQSGIYFMHKGKCVTSNTFFKSSQLQGKENGLQCLLAYSEDAVTTAQGKWLYPDGTSVDCTVGTNNKNPFACFTTNISDGVTMYKSSKGNTLQDEYNGVYTCCLPGNCSEDSSNRITVRIFHAPAIADLYVTLPEDVTAIPQKYTVHCVIDEQCDCAKSSPVIYYFMEGAINQSAVQFCDKEPSLLSCVQETNNKATSFIDNQLTVTWNAQMIITEGTYFPQEKSANGDHDFLCKAVYNSTLNGKETDDIVTVSVRAPNFTPSALAISLITATNLTLSWALPSSPPDADGYVIHYKSSSTTGLDMSVKVEGGSISEYTLRELASNTKYTITIRAYQDILGPASEFVEATTNVSEDDHFSGLFGGIIAVMVVAMVLVTVAIVLVIFGVYRRQKNIYHNPKSVPFFSTSADSKEEFILTTQLYQSSNEGKSGPHQTAVDEHTPPPKVEEQLSMYAEPSDNYIYASVAPKTQREKAMTFDPQIPVTIPVSLGKLGSHVGTCHSNDNESFIKQFKALYSGEDLSCIIGLSPEKKAFNRFRNIAPYDHNRIVLRELDDSACLGEYINASFVDGFGSARKFIAAQGPLKKTVVDFWRMVWQERPQIIVMVTNLNEGGKSKCEQYWPSSQFVCESYGPFTVSLMDEQVLPDIIVRKIRVWFGEDSDTFHLIMQYHFVSWPDHGIPEYPTPLMTLHKRVMSGWYPESGPILVHCSAGVGRTGTFIALDLALEQADRKGEVDIAGIINRLRQQRMKMIQTEEQYVFLHDLILEALLCGNTEIFCESFSTEMAQLEQPDSKTGQSGLQMQFEKLDKICHAPDEDMYKTAKQNSVKNRSNKYLPSDRWRVPLYGEYPGYIHATSIKGYKSSKAFIIAQSPMENTVRDFWKMVIENKVPAIVMLLESNEEIENVCSPYWKSQGEYSVKECSQQRVNGIIKRELQVVKEENIPHPVTHFQILDWPTDGQIRETSTILHVIEELIRVQQRKGSGPVVVHCSDTVGRSGVYCAVSNALEQCKLEGVVDVFQVVKAIRIQKPGAVTSVEQYSSIFKLVDSYISMYSTYSNFKDLL